MANTFRNSGQVGLTWSIGMDAGTATKGIVLDSAFILGTSGDAIGIRFCSPVTQTNGALLFYAMSDDQAAAPEYTCTLHDSAASAGTATIPAAGAALATSDEIVDPADDEWQLFTFSGVTLVAGSYYWIIIKNTEAVDPVTNKGSFYTRAALDGHVVTGSNAYLSQLQAYTSLNGFQTGTLSSSGIAPVVIKFADGSVMGFPYVAAGAAHASNANFRGNRFSIPGNVMANGIFFLTGSLAATVNALTIYDAAGNVIVSKTPDEVGEDNGAFFVATNLTGGVAYDYVVGFSAAAASGTLYTMGEIEANVPADVKLAAIATYIDGATPGSFTADTSMIMGYILYSYQDIPAIDISDADLTVAEAPTGKKFYAVSGGVKTGTGTKTLSAANDTVAAGYYAATTLSAVDADLAVGNIKSGTTIFGFAGTYAGGGGGKSIPNIASI